MEARLFLFLALCLQNSFFRVKSGPPTCSSVVTVDRQQVDSDIGCSLSSNLNESGCSDLQPVLLQADDSINSTCIEVAISPGTYSLTTQIRINASIILRAISLGSVVITAREVEGVGSPELTEPFSVLTFVSSAYVEITGLVFEWFPGLINMTDITTVKIENSSFRYFFQGAVDIYNCIFVTVTNCTFRDNGPVAIVKTEPHRGHSGGLSIAWSILDYESNHTTVVERCLFVNNTSDPFGGSFQYSTTQSIVSRQFRGRGGGAAIIMNGRVPVQVTVSDCVFEQNYAGIYGGGLYTNFDGLSHYFLTINNSRFHGNSGGTAAGGLEVGFAAAGDPQFTNEIHVHNTEFDENFAQRGGASFIVVPQQAGPKGAVGSFARFQNCTFVGNRVLTFGAAVGMSSGYVYEDKHNTRPFEFHSCTFTENDGGQGGVLGFGYFPGSLSGSNVFKDNIGSGIQILGSLVTVSGSLSFQGGDAVRHAGGAVYIVSFGQMQLSRNTKLYFYNNTGNLGSAIVVEPPIGSGVFGQLLYNPLCFLLYEDKGLPPGDWQGVEIHFAGNLAAVGSSLYASDLDVCSWTGYVEPLFNKSGVFRWSTVKHSGNDVNSAHTSDMTNPAWYVQTPPYSLIVDELTVQAYPGGQLKLSISALDELEHKTTTVFMLSEPITSFNNVSTLLQFHPSVVLVSSVEEPVQTHFSQTSSVVSGAAPVLVDTPLEYAVQRGVFEMNVTQCPPGYTLHSFTSDEVLYDCTCDLDNSLITECNQTVILISKAYWATEDLSDSDNNLFLYPCPTGYCQCVYSMTTSFDETCMYIFDSSNPDSQCSCDREGILCGTCSNSSGVSALLNKCVSCSSASSLLIVALVVLDLAVFLCLLIRMKPLPTFLYPCSFYVQILPYMTQYFPASFQSIFPYGYYIGSGLGFYFIYDFCLFNGMSTLVAHAMRLLPLLLFVITLSVLPILRKLHRRWSKWHGVWWVLLLLYPHSVYTAVSLLHCPSLPATDNLWQRRWFLDGNVKCFTSEHLAVSIIAVLLLLIHTAFIAVVIGYTTNRLKWPRVVYIHLSEAFSTGYRNQLSWWAGVELTRRMVTVVLTVVLPGSQYAVLFTVMVFMVIYGYSRPYKQLIITVLEVALSVDVLLLLLLPSTQSLLALDTVSNVPSLSRCEVHSTTFSWLLLFFYYLPPLVTFVLALTWLATPLWTAVLSMLRNSDHHHKHYSKRLSRKKNRVTIPVTELYILKDEDTLLSTVDDEVADYVLHHEPECY